MSERDNKENPHFTLGGVPKKRFPPRPPPALLLKDASDPLASAEATKEKMAGGGSGGTVVSKPHFVRKPSFAYTGGAVFFGGTCNFKSKGTGAATAIATGEGKQGEADEDETGPPLPETGAFGLVHNPNPFSSRPATTEIASPTLSTAALIAHPGPRVSLTTRMLSHTVVSRQPSSPLSPPTSPVLAPVSPISPSGKRHADFGEEAQPFGKVSLSTLESPPPDVALLAQNPLNQNLLDCLMEEAKVRMMRKFQPYRWSTHVSLSFWLVDGCDEAILSGEHAAGVCVGVGIGKGMKHFIDTALGIIVESSERISSTEALLEEREEFVRVWGADALMEEEEGAQEDS